MNRVTFGGLWVIALAMFAVAALAQDIPVAGAGTEFDGKIAFLRDGDVYTINSDGSGLTAVTQSGGKVADFCFSPALEYLAITREFKRVGSPYGYEDDDTSTVPIESVVFIDLGTMEEVYEIEPGGEWPGFGQWIARDKLVYYLSSGYDVAGFAVCDVANRKRIDPDYHSGHDLFFGYFNDDRSVMLYVSDSGLGPTFRDLLHLVDLQTGHDTVVVQKRAILGYGISRNQRYIGYYGAESSEPGTIREYWILDRELDSAAQVYPSPTVASAYGDGEWSFGDSLIGFFGGNQGIVVTAGDQTELARIEGSDFSWCDDNSILLSRGTGVYVYDLISGQERLVVEDATGPVFLKAAGGSTR